MPVKQNLMLRQFSPNQQMKIRDCQLRIKIEFDFWKHSDVPYSKDSLHFPIFML